MRSFTTLSIGLAMLLVGILLLTTLYTEQGARVLSGVYRSAVDTTIGLVPSFDPLPNRENIYLMVSIGIPVFPGNYLVSVYGDGEVYIYDDREFFVVDGLGEVFLSGYFYRVSALLDPGERLRVGIERIDGDVSLYILVFIVLGLLLSLLGVGGWRGLSRSRG